MASELKVFGYVMDTSGDETKRLGLPSHIRQVRAIVAAKTKREAADKFGINSGTARDFMGETGNEIEIAQAMSKPGQVFASAMHAQERRFIEIEREPYVSIPRPKRMSFTDRLALDKKRRQEQKAREFNREELEYLVEMFTGANNPVAASLAEKAKLKLGAL